MVLQFFVVGGFVEWTEKTNDKLTSNIACVIVEDCEGRNALTRIFQRVRINYQGCIVSE